MSISSRVVIHTAQIDKILGYTQLKLKIQLDKSTVSSACHRHISAKEDCHYCDEIRRLQSVYYEESAKHVLIHHDRVYYTNGKEIWSLVPTSPYVYTHQIFKTDAEITDLAIRDDKVCYQLNNFPEALECKFNLPTVLTRPAAILSEGYVTAGPYYMPTNYIYPVSASGRHFASRKTANLCLITMTDKNELYVIQSECSYVITAAMLSNEDNTFITVGDKGITTWQFSENSNTQIAFMPYPENGNVSFCKSKYYKPIPLQNDRHVIFTEQSMRINEIFYQLFLFDAKETNIRKLNMTGYDIEFSAPYLIIICRDSIKVFHIKNINEKNFLQKADAQFEFDGVGRVLAWPYDADKGQLWAVAYTDYDSKTKLMLVKFKEGCALEKIRIIEELHNVDLHTMFIAKNQLYYKRPPQLVSFDPETGRTYVNEEKDTKINSRYMIKGLGTPMGVLSEDLHRLFLDPYPEHVRNIPDCKESKEFYAIADAISVFSFDVVGVVASFLNAKTFRQSWSLPPAVIKRSAKEEAILQKLDDLTKKTQGWLSLCAALVDLKQKLVLRRKRFDVSINTIEEQCKELLESKGSTANSFLQRVHTKPKVASIFSRIVPDNIQLKFEICQFFDEIRKLDASNSFSCFA